MHWESDSDSGDTDLPSLFNEDDSYRYEYKGMSFSPKTGFQLEGTPAAVAAVGLVGFFLANAIGGRAEYDDYERRTKRAQKRAEKAGKRAAESAKKEEEERIAREEAELQATIAAREKEEIDQRLRLEQELRKLGIEPDREVTDEEVRNARLTVGYVDGRTNIAVVGGQNEGKSTFVNCVRGVEHGTSDSATIGEAEVLISPTPYLDHRHKNLVWHDVPGGGTRNSSAWGYYFSQKLFAYDKILLIHSSTLTDGHIRNCRRRRNHASVEAAKKDFIEQVRQDTKAQNALASSSEILRPDFTDHIISEMGVWQLSTGCVPSQDEYEQVIDEQQLFQELGIAPNCTG
ncbi:hypothetical protein Purlil1_13480 [Purpureocillium lilacinum]|uniref:IRG-type G domain-containing protein n=1 Tax=Purpureocillium lilacinum TaxID=33203 RepID=A0ABR0BDW9_PURLI|nr:hypothetical protein Purlil1_13480 [Purpureocillium lilacinum]